MEKDKKKMNQNLPWANVITDGNENDGDEDSRNGSCLLRSCNSVQWLLKLVDLERHDVVQRTNETAYIRFTVFL